MKVEACPPSIRLQGVTRDFAGRRVLPITDFDRSTPGIVAVIGANGSGKTSLLRIIAQLLETSSGGVTVCGLSVERADTPAARRLTGWAPHEPLAWGDDTVAANLRLAAALGGERRPSATNFAREALAAWALEPVEHMPVRNLSRGWAQRYSIARADMLAPPILLLDEPTVGLDAAGREVLDARLELWRRSRIVIVATHEHTWIAGHADATIDLGPPAG